MEDEEEPTHSEEEEEVPESAQPAFRLPSSRLDQHEGKAQVDGGMETSEEESNARGKSGDSNIVVKDCTVAVDLQSQLSILKDSIPDTRQAIITFQGQSVQMFFSPENAIADFKRKVKELWNIPVKMYYLIANGIHESLVKAWHNVTSVSVNIRGMGGRKTGQLTLFLEGEEIRCKTNQTFRQALETRDIEPEDFLLHTPRGTTVTLDNDNNTFAWSGHSGVLGCTGQRRVAPAARWCMPSTHTK
jgi:hypothetical protein